MVSKVECETIDTRSLELESIISHMTIIFEVRAIYRLLLFNQKATSTLPVSTGKISVAFSVSGKINLSGIYLWYILSLSHHPNSCHSGWR